MSSNTPASAASHGSASTFRPRPAAADSTLEVHDPPQSAAGDLSGIEFCARALEGARDATLPALDRLRALSIFSTKLDELFAVRVAGLKQQIAHGGAELRAEALLASGQIDRIAARTRELLEVQHAAWREGILPTLAGAGIRLLAPAEMSPEQRDDARRRFLGSVFPALTPLAVDPGHPFPHLRGRSLCLAVSLRRGEGRRRRNAAAHLLAVVEVPPALPRLFRLHSGSGRAYTLLEEVIAESVSELFPGHPAGDTAVFRVTRRRDLDASPEGPRSTARSERRRDRGAAVRLELSAGASRDIEMALVAALRLEPRDVYRITLPLQIADLLALDGRREGPS